MKLKQWLFGATALAMLAACSDKDFAPDSGGGSPQEGSGYVGINIQLPTVPSTRANDEFNDGVASEYKLNDAVLLLFQGANEADATCIGAFELKKSQLNADKDDNTQITTQVTRVANVSGVDLDENVGLYALVITNAIENGLCKKSDLYSDWMKTTENGATRGKKIKELQETVLDKNYKLFTQGKAGVGYASSIVMTNSPLTEAQGGKNEPTTVEATLPVLVKLNNKVWPSEAEALANPAGIIHVERAVGKITCSSINTETDVVVTIGDKKYRLIVDKVSWDMAQDMANTFIVRNTNLQPVKDVTANPDGTTGNLWSWNYASEIAPATAYVDPAGAYRMIGHTPIPADGKNYYRPYFCQVPGFGVKVDGKDHNENKVFNKETMEFKDAQTWTNQSAFYPRENTFPVEYMKYANTTRIGFWMTFKFRELQYKTDGEGNQVEDKTVEPKDLKGDNFYTKGLDKSTIYLQDDKGNDPLTSKIIANLTAKTEVKKAVEDAMNKDEGTGYDNLDLGDFLDFTYDEAKRAESGEIVVTSISFKQDLNASPYKDYPGLFKAVPNFEGSQYSFENDIDRLNNLDLVYEYTGGQVFYEVRIKHFGDDLTNWNKDDHEQASVISESYGTDASKRSTNYLGRYGIVRNNWYDLNVSVITKLGDPQDPAKWNDQWPGKPDDNKDQYIAVILRVLSWAKRTQNVVF